MALAASEQCWLLRRIVSQTHSHTAIDVALLSEQWCVAAMSMMLLCMCAQLWHSLCDDIALGQQVVCYRLLEVFVIAAVGNPRDPPCCLLSKR